MWRLVLVFLLVVSCNSLSTSSFEKKISKSLKNVKKEVVHLKNHKRYSVYKYVEDSLSNVFCLMRSESKKGDWDYLIPVLMSDDTIIVNYSSFQGVYYANDSNQIVKNIEMKLSRCKWGNREKIEIAEVMNYGIQLYPKNFINLK
jgi:hypothetical protein